MKLDVGDKKYKIEVIENNAIYIKKLADYLIKFYYLVS